MGARVQRELKVELSYQEADCLLRLIGYAFATGEISRVKAGGFCKLYERLNSALLTLERNNQEQSEVDDQ